MAYTATVTLDLPAAERISRNLGVMTGLANVTSYHATLAEMTNITKYFISGRVLHVFFDAVSDEGFMFVWNTTSKAAKVYATAGASHSHNLVLDDSVAGTLKAVFAGTNILRVDNAGGGDITVAGGGASGGISATTPANASVAEAADDTDVGESGFMAV